MTTTLLPVLFLATAAPAPPPFEVESAAPLPALTRQFERTDGWTGADGAYSLPLGPRRTLWLFADTWVGKVEGGKRVGPRMVNNTAAWQDLGDERAPLRFFWGGTAREPKALLRPPEADAWYWPGDGVLIDGRLYLFCKVVTRREKGPPGFQFDWFANDLLRIDNPTAEPTDWRVGRRCRLPSGPAFPRLGAACLLEGDYLYAYGLFPVRDCKFLHTPLAVARIHRRDLPKLDLEGWRYWARGPEGERWSERPDALVPLFTDGAPELSVGRLRGVAGLVVTYTSLGLGREVCLRHAARPEGPWSASVRAYRCPEAGKLLLYGAKAHPELAGRDGELIVTYCRNTGDLGEHVRRPELYVPQGVKVQLRPRR
jgi:hypothetical protein